MTINANHLAEETSPYLRQHSLNPVDWYPWGPIALKKLGVKTNQFYSPSAIQLVTGVM